MRPSFLDLGALQSVVHQNAIDKGWWLEPRSWEEARVLIMTEIAEAVEAYRTDGGFLDRLGTVEILGHERKPEGLASELADIVIRSLDYCGSLGKAWEVSDSDYLTREARLEVDLGIPGNLDGICSLLYRDRAWFFQGKDAEQYHLDILTKVIGRTFAIANADGVDLASAIYGKHRYNTTRPYRHGGKHA